MTEFKAPHSIRSNEFTIRAYELDDAQSLTEATNGSYAHLKTFMPWATETQTLEETQALIRGFIENYAEGSDFVLSIWRNEDGLLLGGTGFHLREGGIEGGCAEIGMWIRGDLAGRGIGRRALGMILDWAFTEWPFLRLAWRCNGKNVASVRCAEANHLLYEGTLRGQFNPVTGGRRDTACYAILKEEWQALHKKP